MIPGRTEDKTRPLTCLIDPAQLPLLQTPLLAVCLSSQSGNSRTVPQALPLFWMGFWSAKTGTTTPTSTFPASPGSPQLPQAGLSQRRSAELPPASRTGQMN